jgi:hypothetical protein
VCVDFGCGEDNDLPAGGASRGVKQAAKERGTSEAELIPTAVRHELLGAPAAQQERAKRRARLLAAMGKLDSSAYPSGYLDELRAKRRG